MPNTAQDALSGAGIGATIGSVGGPIGTAIGAGVGLLAGAMAGLFGDAGRQQAIQYLQASIPGWSGLNPTEQAQVVQQIDSSAYNKASNAGNTGISDALGALEAKYNAGGMDAVDKGKAAALAQAQAQQTQANEARVQENAAKSGTLGSGNALVAQLMGSQGAGQAAATQSVQQAAAAEAAREKEMTDAGQLGNELQQNAYRVAGANDAVNEFNANIASGNANRNLEAQNQTFGNEAQQQGALTGINTNLANTQVGNANQQQSTIAALGGGAQSAATALGNYNWGGGGNSNAVPAGASGALSSDNQLMSSLYDGYG